MASQEQAPRQETLEQQPLNANEQEQGGYGSVRRFSLDSFKHPSPQEMDAHLPPKLREICNDWIVATDQFDEMENASGALLCARVLRMFLIFFIITSTLGLIVGFVLKASLAAPMETEQYSVLDAPSVILCPSPWGSQFLGFSVKAVSKGIIPGSGFVPLPTTNWTAMDFDTEFAKVVDKKGNSLDRPQFLVGCKHIQLNGVLLHPLGKVAQYTGFETISVRFNAQTEDGRVNFGFGNGDNEMPQRWSYGSLGMSITGEIKYDQVNVGASEVSEGTPRSILNFSPSGSANLGSDTELNYYFGYFMVRVLSAQAKGLTVFSIVAFVLLVAAAVNNCGLFELFFVEYVPDDEPPPALVPNILCQSVCGRCCAACRRRKQKSSEEGSNASGDFEKVEEQKA